MRPRHKGEQHLCPTDFHAYTTRSVRRLRTRLDQGRGQTTLGGGLDSGSQRWQRRGLSHLRTLLWLHSFEHAIIFHTGRIYAYALNRSNLLRSGQAGIEFCHLATSWFPGRPMDEVTIFTARFPYKCVPTSALTQVPVRYKYSTLPLYPTGFSRRWTGTKLTGSAGLKRCNAIFIYSDAVLGCHLLLPIIPTMLQR